jgi:hypothetical protein
MGKLFKKEPQINADERRFMDWGNHLRLIFEMLNSIEYSTKGSEAL